MGKLMPSTTSPLMMQMMVILTAPVLASKVKPKSTINWLVSVSGNMNSKATVLNLKGSSKDKTRLAFAGLKFGDYGSIDYGRNYGVAYDIGAWTDVLPEFGGDTGPKQMCSWLVALQVLQLIVTTTSLVWSMARTLLLEYQGKMTALT